MLAIDFRPSWPLKSARMAATHYCASHGRGRPRHWRFAYFARFAAVSQMARRRDAFTGFALQGTPAADYSPSPSAFLARSGCRVMKGFKNIFCVLKLCTAFEEIRQFFRLKNKTRAERRRVIAPKIIIFNELFTAAV